MDLDQEIELCVFVHAFFNLPPPLFPLLSGAALFGCRIINYKPSGLGKGPVSVSISVILCWGPPVQVRLGFTSADFAVSADHTPQQPADWADRFLSEQRVHSTSTVYRLH